MSISFNDVPSALRVPFVAVEFDSSRASPGPAVMPYRAALIGQKTSSGTATANTLYRVTSAAQVQTLAGRGSMLHRQAIAWFAAKPGVELWIAVLADDGAGVAASGTLTVTGPATASGTIALYLGGKLVNVAVTSGDSANAIATAIGAAINADLDLPVTASVASAVVTVTFRHKGLTGNSYDMRHSYRDDEALPAGVGVAVVALANGTTAPSLSSLIAAMGDTQFHIIAHPYTDATSLAALEAELTSRNDPMRMIDGLAITSAVGSFGTLTTLGGGRNNRHSTILAQPGTNPLTPPWEFAAEAAALVARYGSEDPSRPLHTLQMTHALPPAEVDKFTLEERNLLLYDGIGTTVVGAGSVVELERVITTYQTNAAGAADEAYLDATTLLTLMYLRYSWRVWIQSRYPRHKLADDGARFGAGQKVMTPKLGRGEALSWFRAMEERGLVEGYEQFEADLVVERNVSNRNRMDWLLSPDLINQLIVRATQIAFRL